MSVCRVSVCRVVECGRRLLPDAHCTTLHHAVWSSVRHTAHLTRDPPRTRKLCPRPEPAIGACKESKRLNHCPMNNHCCLRTPGSGARGGLGGRAPSCSLALNSASNLPSAPGRVLLPLPSLSAFPFSSLCLSLYPSRSLPRTVSRAPG